MQRIILGKRGGTKVFVRMSITLLSFLRQDIYHWAQSSPVGQHTQSICLHLYPELELYTCTTVSIICGCWESRLVSSYFCGKHFTKWVISPALQLFNSQPCETSDSTITSSECFLGLEKPQLSGHLGVTFCGVWEILKPDFKPPRATVPLILQHLQDCCSPFYPWEA